MRALADFKANKVVVLVATEVAARGLDIKELPHVVNYELPNVPEDYVHRIGRTARAGGTGAAVSLVSPDEGSLLRDIERVLRKTIPFVQTPEFKITNPPPRSNEAQRQSDEQRAPQGRGGHHRGGAGRPGGGGGQRHGSSGRGGGGHGRPGQGNRGGGGGQSGRGQGQSRGGSGRAA